MPQHALYYSTRCVLVVGAHQITKLRFRSGDKSRCVDAQTGLWLICPDWFVADLSRLVCG